MFWILTAATAFLTLSCLYLAATEGQRAQRRLVVDRMGRLLGADVAAAAVESILRADQSDLGSMLSGAAKRYRALRNLELMLYRAGKPMTLARLLGLTLGFTGVGAVAGMVLGFGPLPALVGAGPILFVRRMKNKRMRAFDEQFPQALALFSRALRAGHSMSSALQMVGSELGDPVGPEFAVVAREISLGLAPATALANLQARLEAHDLPVFVTAVLVQLETGGNLAETLDNLGDVIRTRILFYGKVKALTAQSMMSANILVVVPFGIAAMMYCLSPGFMDPMLASHGGRIALGAAFAMALMGWIVCRRMARVDV
jgi:tight adherence protein B